MRLFLDMDGVLADFDRGYGDRFGVRPSKADDNVDWNLVRSTPNFYRDLPPMEDMEELVAFCMDYRPVILTGVPSNVPEAQANKWQWVQKNLGPGFPMIGCRSVDKSKHLLRGDILVDDWEKHKDLWIARGGLWITHTSAKSSIFQLRALRDEGYLR